MEVLKKLGVVSDSFAFNVDIHDGDVALIDMQSFRSEDEVGVAEIVVSKEEIKEMIRMLEYASNSME